MNASQLALETSAPPKRPLMDVFSSNALLLLLIALFVVLSMSVPHFFSARNVQGLVLSVALIGALAVTMMLVLALAEVDLSVGSTVAFSGVVAASVVSVTQSIWMGVLAGIVAGGLVGAVNGLLVAWLRINSLIATLAMMEMVRGLAYICTGGNAVMITQEDFFELGVGQFLGLSYPIWVMLMSFLLFGALLNRTVFGKNVLAIGGNSEAAFLAGIAVQRIKLITFTLQGLAAGLAGVLLTSRLGLGDPKTSMGLELAVISACVLGGVSMAGGVATIRGVIVGVLIMGTVQNAMSLLNIDTFFQYLVRGGILLAAVLIDQIKHRNKHA